MSYVRVRSGRFDSGRLSGTFLLKNVEQGEENIKLHENVVLAVGSLLCYAFIDKIDRENGKVSFSWFWPS